MPGKQVCYMVLSSQYWKRLPTSHVHQSSAGWDHHQEEAGGSSNNIQASTPPSKLLARAAHDPQKILLQAKARCQKVFIQLLVQLLTHPSPAISYL